MIPRRRSHDGSFADSHVPASVDVSRILEKYRDLLRSFVIEDISADQCEVDFLGLFKDDSDQVAGAEFDILDRLFADVDDYVGDTTLRKSAGGIDGAELRARARDAYARLFDVHE